MVAPLCGNAAFRYSPICANLPGFQPWVMVMILEFSAFMKSP